MFSNNSLNCIVSVLELLNFFLEFIMCHVGRFLPCIWFYMYHKCFKSQWLKKIILIYLWFFLCSFKGSVHTEVLQCSGSVITWLFACFNRNGGTVTKLENVYSGNASYEAYQFPYIYASVASFPVLGQHC